uniref:hypothetical protein n=1 Tax=Streptomyces sp. SS7 TaxID=3108485 RepID=UPI00403FD11B
MDLTARHPRRGELLSTVKFLVRILAAGELQRDLTYKVDIATRAARQSATGANIRVTPYELSVVEPDGFAAARL